MVSSERYYSQTVNQQDNPNLTVVRNQWNYTGNAVGHTPDFAVSKYTRKGKKGKYTYVVPHIVSAHDFRLNIPENAYVKKVTIQVCMKVDSSKLEVNAPTAYFMVYEGNGKVTQQKTAKKTGWYGSTYRVYSNKKVSTSEQVFDYVFSGTEWNKMGYPTARLNHSVFGVDLHFEEPSKMTSDSVGVSLRWVAVIVEYDLPNWSLSYDKVTSGENPLELNVGDTHCVTATLKNVTKANDDNQVVNIQLPFSSELISSTSRLTVVDEDKGLYTWECNGKREAVNKLKLCLTEKAFGLKTLVLTHNNIEYPYYIYNHPFQNKDYVDFHVENGTVQKNEESCFTFSNKVRSNTDTITYGITVDGDELTDWSNVSSAFLEYYQNPNHGNNLVDNWKLHDDSANQGVSIASYTNNTITFNVPQYTDIEIKFSACFIPLFIGTNHLSITDGDDTYSHEYYSEEDISPKIRIGCADEAFWEDCRLLTEVTPLGYVIPIGVNPMDAVMVEEASAIRMRIWEDIAYIASIPLKQSHYEPDHDTTNGGLSETKKNKTYKGKTGEIKDDTSLKIKLPPKDWTTLHGFTKIDKPIPINTVPAAFEGDVLNFRGWYEINGIKGVKKVNSLYYDGQVEVDPLTRNINTRFTIKKGEKIITTDDANLLLASVVESGDEFAQYTYKNDDGDIVTNDTGYFSVNTDGVYVYDADEEERFRTVVSLDNKQSLNIKSYEHLPELSEISLNWLSTKIDENRENNIERIIYLKDKDGNIVFKYQYHDYVFDTDDEYFKCTVTATKMLEGGSEETLYDREIILAVDIESLQLTVDPTGNIVQEKEPNIDAYTEEELEELELDTVTYNDFLYGSNLTFTLNQNKLSVVDTGYTGRAVEFTTELINGVYDYELEFINRNTDGDTLDVLTFIDFEVDEGLITTDFGNDYKDLLVSSFPLAHKELMFTRECDEGTLFFYKDDGTEASYIQEPFYMYFCGVDLQNQKGSSIFDLDNSYSVFYLSNGLVKLGLNRLNGDLYLYKYDEFSQEWINIVNLHTDNTDFQVVDGAFSDDKISIKAGTTIYTMYRGHPYVVINHENEDLKFNSVWNTVFGEKINDDEEEFPIYWDLKNHSNLLPACVCEEDISCLTVVGNDIVENTNVIITPTLTLTAPNTDIYNNTPCIFTLSGTNDIVSEGILILIDGEVSDVISVSNGEAVKDNDDNYVTESVVTSDSFAVIFPDNKQHSIKAVYRGNSTKHIAYTENINIVPLQYESSDPNDEVTGNYELTVNNIPKKWEYMSKVDWSFKLTKGGVPVANKTVEIDLPNGNVASAETPLELKSDSTGIIPINTPSLPSKLNPFRNWTVGKKVVRARFYHYDEPNDDKVVLTSASQSVEITKGTPKLKFTPADTKGKNAKFMLQDPQGYGLANKKLSISVNGGKAITKTTNSKGNVSITINKKGHMNYKIKFVGDSNLKAKTWTKSETVR